MSERLSLTVDAAGRGTRVDRYLAERTLLSRSALQRLLKGGQVRVDGRGVEPAHRVRTGERIEVVVPEERPPAELVAEDIPVAVLYEDQDVLVVNKPAGLVVHPAAGHAAGTLVNAILAHLGGETGRAERRPGIVHRLDKDTSGALIVAKHDAAHQVLARQLQSKRFGKEYLALVWGDPGAERAVVETPLARDPKDRRRVAISPSGREAVTRFARIAAWRRRPEKVAAPPGEALPRRRPSFGPLALLHVEPVTGRTHQIRAHLAFAGYPVVGDPVYGRRSDPTGLARQFLHAWRLTVRLPHAGERTFTAPLPHDLRAVLASLGAPSVRAPLFGEAAPGLHRDRRDVAGGAVGGQGGGPGGAGAA